LTIPHTPDTNLPCRPSSPIPILQSPRKPLDSKRLANQRNEATVIYKTLTALEDGGFYEGQPYKGWPYHPATLMWKGYRNALLAYRDAMIFEHVRRGATNTIPMSDVSSYTPPPWLGDKAFHVAHQSNLIRKDPSFYGPIFPGVPGDLPYMWPVRSRA
jgi:hypothetical protein